MRWNNERTDQSGAVSPLLSEIPDTITVGKFRRSESEIFSVGNFRDGTSEIRRDRWGANYLENPDSYPGSSSGVKKLSSALDFIMKKIIIIAGPNGAGKTTFAREFLPNEAGCPQFVNADLIAAGLSPFAPDVAAVRAARIMLESITELERRGVSFAFETTLSGLVYARRIRRWREYGYHVTLFFLSLPNPQMAIERVAERVRQGGHDVPSDIIRRRFAAGLRNFEQVYRDAVDTWAMYDNSGDEPVQINWGEKP